MREIIFYRTAAGHCPVEEFLDSLEDKQAQKVAWVLRLIRDLEIVPLEYFKKLVHTDNIWEVRITHGGQSFRLLGFFYKSRAVILTNGFAKKKQKTPQKEILLAEQRKKDFLERNK